MRHGVLVVDKPAGCTSHDVVCEARRRFGMRRVGHAGTLDPMATGVLVLLLGEACKLSAYLTQSDKAYRARVAFGIGTHTLDADGEVVEARPLPPDWLERQPLGEALAAELARRLQLPPRVSSIKLEGKRAHARVRRGEQFELAPRAVAVREIAVLCTRGLELDLELTVSKGYYVRALARDLGIALGAPAHLAALRRLRSGSFGLDQATAWPSPHEERLLSLAAAARHALPVTELTRAGAAKVRDGKMLGADDARGAAAPGEVSAWFADDGRLVALGTALPGGGYRVLRGIVPEAQAYG